jgi:hypothetical protein
VLDELTWTQTVVVSVSPPEDPEMVML